MTPIIPRALTEGSTIAIISPAGIAREPATTQAAEVLRSWGYNVRIMPHACGRHGSFSGSVEERLADITAALTDSEAGAILCSRGGYGAVHLLPLIPRELIRENAKWLIGFSDVSALHALWLSAGVASVHGPMAKHICSSVQENSANPKDLQYLTDILTRGRQPHYDIDPHPLNVGGRAQGILVGGNFSVISALASTPYDPLTTPESILFIEDINEPVYKIERLMWRLMMSPCIANIRGLIVGDFTGVAPDINHHSMYDMISAAVAGRGIPVAFGFPAGHGAESNALLLGAEATLEVGSDGVSIS